MSEPAYMSDELGLTEAQRIDVEQAAKVAPQPTAAELLACIRRNGRVDGILESALGLPLADYRNIKAAWLAAPIPDRPRTRRRS